MPLTSPYKCLTTVRIHSRGKQEAWQNITQQSIALYNVSCSELHIVHMFVFVPNISDPTACLRTMKINQNLMSARYFDVHQKKMHCNGRQKERYPNMPC